MKVNWKVRFKHPAFYTALVALIGFILTDLQIMDLGRFDMYAKLLFGVLVAGGVITDLTTPGVTDSDLSMRKDKPINGEDIQ